jgi:signal transduction histidine kinase
MKSVRGAWLGVSMVVAVALVLVFAVRNLKYERARLLEGFAATQAASARATASSLEDRLRNLIEDAHLIGALVQRNASRTGHEAADSEQSLLSSLDAMTNVVRPYRSLAVVTATGRVRLSAVDTTERPLTAAALLKLSESASTRRTQESELTGPVEVVPGRYMYLYALRAGDETIAITVDASLFLRFRAIAGAEIVVTDPAGFDWIDCVVGRTCLPRRHGPPERWRRGSSEAARLDANTAAALGLPATTAVAAWRTVEQPSTGAWRVTVAASAALLADQESALERELVITAGGLLSAIGVIGALIVRQQRHAAVLAERLRNSETLRSLEGQLIRAEKLSTTGVLTAGIAHEIGTPLGIIRARAELLIDESLSASGRRAIDTIIGQTDHISSTIREVLDFSRSQAVELRPVPPERAIAAATALLEHRLQQQDLRVHVEVEAGVPDVAADASQLQQVLVNLIMNACDACSTGGQIWISVRRLDELNVLWEVRDNGSGIPEEHLLAVFDPFFTTKKRGEGTGLGLSVATGIVRNHGGEISLASILGEGTTVTIRWPIAKERTHAEG